MPIHSHINRRSFLKTVSAGAIAATAIEVLGTPSIEAQQASSTKSARLFSGCCAYTYRNAFKQGFTLEKFIDKAVDLRLDAIDMTVYYMKSTDPGYIENLRWLAYKRAVRFSGAACGTSMVQADPAKRADSLVQIKKWIDVTDRLGASHLRIFAGPLPKGSSLTDATTWVVETMKAAADYSATKGIMVGLEDHYGVSQRADVCLEIMHRVNSPYAGINLDITHFDPKAGDYYQQIASCIPYATNTHIRTKFDDGTPIDMDRVWKMFADAGFKGYMSYEGEELDTPGIPPTIAEINRLCKKYSSV
ncbi:xylose isomerase [Edaphobacter acidisoli]|uniref:Xylose isomerase n=1 Tax=Edaphobacter acidisoli TaxID=2040573 RepID=A0A916RRN3_9BACT|nr:TIM barrel protein [Edaphobacter acidisoli]GGA66383.1 xylose isomerase [Edaphobacter acidisoli]